MSQEWGNKPTSSSARSLLGVVGRVAIWILIGLLLLRGAGAMLAPSQRGVAGVPRKGEGLDLAAAALAVGFARAFLADPPRSSLTASHAEGGRGTQPSGSVVAQAEAAAVEKLGDGREVITVACELRDARTLHIAVPISRSAAGEAAVTGAPWMVAAPSAAGVAPERPRPLAGPGAEAIRRLAGKFVPAYLAARSARDLAYLLAPGAAVRPLGGWLEPLGGLSVRQLGDGEGPRRAVTVAGRFRDLATGAIYRLAYHLDILKRNRWYVRAVEGALS